MYDDFSIDSKSTINDFPPEDPELKTLAPNKTLCGGKYRLEMEAGRGGMGIVWKAWDTISERYVALKFVPPEIRHFEAAIAQVRESFRMIQDLNHQNIRPIYGLEKDEIFGYFVVMKWLEGQPLDSVRLSRSQIFLVLKKVAAALDYAHQFEVVHRDVKPSNIFLQMNGDQIREVFLVDFGISAEIQNSMSLHTGATLRTSGTRAFMPPEQWKGQTQDGRTDQYALAAVAYWLFARRLPFQVADTQMLRECVLLDMPEEIEGVSPEINAAIMRGLAKQRKERFETCGKFVKAMTEKSAPRPQTQPAPRPVQPVIQPVIQPAVQQVIQPVVQPIVQPIVQPVIQPVTQVHSTNSPAQINESPSKYRLPFVFYWKYWLILILSYVISTVLVCVLAFLEFHAIENLKLLNPDSSIFSLILSPLFLYTIILGFNSGLHISQILWNVVKKRKFQFLYGGPISILGFIVGTQELFAFQDSRGLYEGVIIGNIISLILFTIKERWLQPEVWNSPKSWFRLRNLFIGSILYLIIFIVQCSISGIH